jgi:hypothetical protein
MRTNKEKKKPKAEWNKKKKSGPVLSDPITATTRSGCARARRAWSVAVPAAVAEFDHKQLMLHPF